MRDGPGPRPTRSSRSTRATWRSATAASCRPRRARPACARRAVGATPRAAGRRRRFRSPRRMAAPPW
ncbi:MAG: hypothetical protein DI587_18680 [Variovorax paradoxus]|nr:MAG: hypothetical protein DI583_18680 [Variovorax paradoxus]PZQ08093.1 MAG: hypothetical protein DI587_18680 [Variovorax paradoxus]